jgi:hypothetical protein
VLPQASCKSCERLTSGYDTHCADQLVGPNREHLSLRARRSNKRRPWITVRRELGEYRQKVKVPIADHFGALLMFNFQFPGVLLGLPPTEKFVGTIAMLPLHHDAGRRSRLTGKVNVVRRGGFEAPIFGRMLAKVAHSYAVAEYGVDGFDPALPNIIRGIGPQHLAQYVGGEFGQEPPSPYRHEINIETYNNIFSKDYLVVRLRLFANRGTPAYYIVVGTPKTAPPR